MTEQTEMPLKGHACPSILVRRVIALLASSAGCLSTAIAKPEL